MIELSKEQKEIHDNLIDWIDQYFTGKHSEQYITVGGYAGTGKTTLLNILARNLDKFNISFCAFTGKASSVLKNKMRDIMFDGNTISTIHSLIYRPVLDKNGELIDWIRRDKLDCDIIIVDEASMISREIWVDLLSYHKPIIAVGDCGQLPPVSEDIFSLMEHPVYKLTKIHRQAEDNPIIKLSQEIRLEGYIKQGIYGKGIACIDWYNKLAKDTLNQYKPNDNSQLLCGLNKTRIILNNLIRDRLNFKTHIPQLNEKIICLKNNKQMDIMNGQLGNIISIDNFSELCYNIKIMMDGFDIPCHCLIPKSIWNQTKIDICDFFNNPKIKIDCKNFGCNSIDLFTYGYAITVHKSQGSEWEKIILFEEYNSFQSDEDRIKWLYTGITRAKSKLLIIQNY